MLLISAGVSAQVGINTASPHASAALHVTSVSNNKGFLPPRLTKGQRNSIASPAEGLLISCTNCTVEGLQQYINGEWQAIASSNTGDYGTVVNPVTGKVWLDRNLGATQVATSSSDALSYGDLYQWGRAADGHEIRTSATHNSKATSWLSDDGSNVWDGKFIIGFSDWLTPAATDLWTGTSAENNQCPSGYRVPTNAEWNQERRTWSSNNAAGALASPLKLPMAGSRDYIDGSLNFVGGNGNYWSSTASSVGSHSLGFGTGLATIYPDNRAVGCSVRCIMD